MKAWYLSHKRFEKRIIKRWKKRGFNYNDGHMQLLKFAYQTIMFWTIWRNEQGSTNNNSANEQLSPSRGTSEAEGVNRKISNKNKPVGHPTLF